MRIALYTNAPDTPTGYGNQAKQLISRLVADGHEVHVFANYGQIAGVRDWNGVPIWPQGGAQYSLDVVDDYADFVDPDLILTLYDVWVLKGVWKERRVASWVPIDHYPVTPEVRRWAKEHDVVAMSRFGQDSLRQEGIESTYIPHAIERVFTPTPSDVRERMKVPDDAFLVTINAANIGVTPPRKAWSENLQAMAAFMRRHDDVYLYIHTDLLRPNGLPIPILIDALGMPHERLRKVDLMGYRAGLIDEEELARIYSASDILLACSKGEGFGIPVLEAMACGTPAVVSDFSAQPEIVGDTGWKVPGQLDWDHNQGSFFYTPYIPAILEALEEAYAERGARSDAAIVKASEYDADAVYAEMWRPWLANMEQPQKKQKRRGMSNAAKRRARKDGK
jgi:glycosyltransferase involved in cell wall biosynthesis